MINRDKCCICNENIIPLMELPNYPISFTMSSTKNFKFETLSFGNCKNCNNIQLNKLVDVKELYTNKPHNNEVIGKTWTNHFMAFKNFITSINNNLQHVIEIGCPTNKLLKLFNNYDSWTLLDPNALTYDTENILSINSYFDLSFNISNKYNTIINSHLLEH